LEHSDFEDDELATARCQLAHLLELSKTFFRERGTWQNIARSVNLKHLEFHKNLLEEQNTSV
jgi:hypothetical protein